MRAQHLSPSTLTLRLALSALFLATAFVHAAETSRDAALSSDGAVFVASSGVCSDLLPTCAPEVSDRPVLALDIRVPGEPSQRLLVPGTDDVAADGTPAVLYEDVSGSLFLIWESKGVSSSSVNIIRFQDGQFSAVVELSGDIQPLKGPPQVVLTRGEYHLGGTEETLLSRHVRSVLHVVWWEQGPGPEEVFYTPVILADGHYLGHNSVHNLTALDHSEAPQPRIQLPVELHRAPSLEPGRDEHSVVVGFVNPASQHFVAFEMRVVAGELSDLADQLQAEMLAQGELYQSGQLPQFAERIRSHVIEMGHRMHPATLAALADETRTAILAEGPDHDGDSLFLSERIRSHVIEMGSRMAASGGLAASPLDTTATLVIPTRPQSAGAMAHDVCVRIVESRLAPEVGAGSVNLYLAPNGRRAIASWQGADGVYYRESTESGWTEPRRIALDGTVDAARAELILRQRVRER
jgi:hypothetical protein